MFPLASVGIRPEAAEVATRQAEDQLQARAGQSGLPLQVLQL